MQISRTFHIFVSSTFSDLETECDAPKSTFSCI